MKHEEWTTPDAIEGRMGRTLRNDDFHFKPKHMNLIYINGKRFETEKEKECLLIVSNQLLGLDKSGAELIADERKRQVEREGWDVHHDSGHKHDELARAAATYALPPRMRPLQGNGRPLHWPWSMEWWKPTAGTKEGRIRELVKAGALIAADIDRIKRTR